MCRAANRYVANLFAGLKDRFEPAALIPMHTPEEAVAEINFAVRELGFKSVVLHGFAHRAVGAGSTRLDFFGLDSPFDYDPVWAACVENNLAPAFHSSLQSHHHGRSITNYVHNHVNGIAGAHQVLCKSLFLGGVYRRFPQLRIGFLEGGVAWAAGLLADLIGHWEKRGGHAIGTLDPAILDVEGVLELVDKYGTPDMVRQRERIGAHLSRPPGRPAELDEFARAGVTSLEDILEPFENRLFFGCEADDPLIGVGYGLNFEGREAALRPIIGSDVSHWDAPVMNQVIVEAYELLERGLGVARAVQGVHLHQSRAAPWRGQPGLLRGHRRRVGGERGPHGDRRLTTPPIAPAAHPTGSPPAASPTAAADCQPRASNPKWYKIWYHSKNHARPRADFDPYRGPRPPAREAAQRVARQRTGHHSAPPPLAQGNVEKGNELLTARDVTVAWGTAGYQSGHAYLDCQCRLEIEDSYLGRVESVQRAHQLRGDHLAADDLVEGRFVFEE